MKVILLKDVKGVGQRFEERNVAEGYATNYLLPKKLAVPAGSASAAQVKALKESEEAGRVADQARAEARVASIAGSTIIMEVKADDKGHLFEKINASKLAKVVNLESDSIILDTPIKELGTYEVPVRAGEKETKFTLEVKRA